MAFTWSQKEKLRNEGWQAAEDQMADRESQVLSRERQLKKDRVILESESMRVTTLNKVHDELQVVENQAKFDLAKASFESEKADFEIEKKLVANDKLQLQKTVDQAKADYEAQAKVELMHQELENAKERIDLFDKVARAEAASNAKTSIIEAKEVEIARLDELLKVTMGKLTQIDVKGLTIHVENERSTKKEDKE